MGPMMQDDRDDALLRALLDETAAIRPQGPASQSAAGRGGVRQTRRLWRRPMPARRAAAIVICGVVLLLVGRVAWAAIVIQRNVAAMFVPAGSTFASLPTRQLLPHISPSPSVAPLMAAAVAGGARPTTSGATTAVPPGAEPAGPTPSATPRAWPTVYGGLQITSTPQPAQLGAALTGATPALRGLPMLEPIAPAPGDAVTVLIMGVDRRPSERGPARADAIIVARLDPARKRVALLSLPRDLIVQIPGIGYSRINAAPVYGELNPALGGGIELMRKTVSSLLDIPIDYTIEVDFGGFIGAIDAIGGVNIDVPQEYYDPQYPTMDYGYSVAHFLPGAQQMDGATALMYARMRHVDSDFERMKRQQSVVVAAAAQLRSQQTFVQLSSFERLSETLRDDVRIDMPQQRLIGLTWALHDIAPAAIERYTLGADDVQMNVDPVDPYAEYAVPGAVERLAAQLLGR